MLFLNGTPCFDFQYFPKRLRASRKSSTRVDLGYLYMNSSLNMRAEGVVCGSRLKEFELWLYFELFFFCWNWKIFLLNRLWGSWLEFNFSWKYWNGPFVVHFKSRVGWILSESQYSTLTLQFNFDMTLARILEQWLEPGYPNLTGARVIPV